MKWLYLMNLSTTTSMQFLRWELGGPSTKSREMICQAEKGTGNGSNRRGYLEWSGFAWWHTWLEETNFWTSAFIPFQSKSLFQPSVGYKEPWTTSNRGIVQSWYHLQLQGLIVTQPNAPLESELPSSWAATFLAAKSLICLTFQLQAKMLHIF